jgi:hypothetical protein
MRSRHPFFWLTAFTSAGSIRLRLTAMSQSLRCRRKTRAQSGRRYIRYNQAVNSDCLWERNVKRLSTLVLLFVSWGCSGSKGTPSPVFPNMVGEWNGTLTIVAVIAGGPSGSNICDLTFIVNGQSTGDFSGTWTLSGGTATACAQSGSLTGRVSTGENIRDLNLITPLGISPVCTRIAGDGLFLGVLSGRSLTASTNDRLRCSSGGVTGEGDRTLTLSVGKS